MDGFLAVTDPGWYKRLSREPGPKDANFWRPSTRAFRLATRTPFLFKLKAPHHAIAGFGYFAGFTILPDWLAWETFGEANGVEDLEAFRGRLRRIQEGARIAADPGGRIGCCLIAEATFFPEAQWVAPPKDWPPKTQTGARYDLSQNDGRRVWEECLSRTAASNRVLQVRDVAYDGPRYGGATLHMPRLGQGIFRVHVLDAYGRACAATAARSKISSASRPGSTRCLVESRDLLMLPCAWLLGGLRHVVRPGADDQDDYTKLAICTTAGGEACGTGGAVAPTVWGHSEPPSACYATVATRFSRSAPVTQDRLE